MVDGYVLSSQLENPGIPMSKITINFKRRNQIYNFSIYIIRCGKMDKSISKVEISHNESVPNTI